ncbi:MAG: DUF4430 domain-containing protein [Tyzzerella sp.]|nr:DUF4430 domain-containing protein [Tyzzerella sp.]
MGEKKANGKKILIGVVILAVLIAAAALVYTNFKPATTEGAKSIVIEVVDDQGESTEYTVQTDAEYLQQAMDEAEGLTYDGEEGDYGFTVYTVNDVTADFNVDASYWSFYVNGEYCSYGISEQPVADGDEFTIQYEVYEE